MRSLNFYSRKYHIQTGIGLIFLFILCYFIPNQIDWITATPIPEVYIDKIIPFHPIWIWVYVFTYLYVILTYLFFLDESNSRLFVNSFVYICLLGAVAFFFYPTIILRDPYPINPESDLSSYMLYWIRFVDEPKNCFPSFHIAMTFSTSASLYQQGKSKKLWAILFGLLIGYSTMAVKQHYFIDVFAGLFLGALAVILDRRNGQNQLP